MLKSIKDRLNKECSICGRRIKLIRYENHSYRGGHYFGKVELCTKKEEARARKFGTTMRIIDGMEIHVARKDPKPYSFYEYWECPKCYWGGK